MPYLPKSNKKIVQIFVLIAFVFLGVLWSAPVTRAELTWSVAMEEEGEYKPLADGLLFSGTANGKIEISDPGVYYIEGYQVTVDGMNVLEVTGLHTQDPVFFTFLSNEFSDGNHILLVHVSLTNPAFFEVSAARVR